MSTPPRTIWAYAYALSPPQSASRLRSLKALLDRERRAAGLRDATWEARLINDDRVSHILVISDSPALDGEANCRVESALRDIEVGFAVTAPRAIEDEPPAALPPKD